MFEEEVRIKIRSELFEVEESLFSDLPEDEDELEEAIADALAEGEDETDVLEINTFGRCTHDGGRVTFSYDESEENGMQGSVYCGYLYAGKSRRGQHDTRGRGVGNSRF